MDDDVLDDPRREQDGLASGVLYPSLGLLLSPIGASAAMNLSSVAVIANALRLRSLAL